MIDCTSMMTTMGTMNAKIAPSSDSIQQLLHMYIKQLYCKHVCNYTLTNHLSHNVHELSLLKLQLLEWMDL